MPNQTQPNDSRAWTRGDLVLLVVTTSVCVLVVLDANMVALSLPSISRDFGTAFDQLEWVISAYLITFTSCMLPAGGFADRFGRRTVLLSGLVVFTVASIGCGTAHSPTTLDAWRAVQGIGAAFQLTSALSIIGNAFTGTSLASKAWAIWGTCIGLTTCLAPIIGGVFTDVFGWRSIFLINGPLGIVIFALVRSIVPDSRSATRRPLDIAGSLLFACSLGVLIWALISANGAGWLARPTLIKWGVAFVSFVVFLLVEQRRAHAMVDLKLFRSGVFNAGVIGMFGYAASAQVLLTLFPLYLQVWFNVSPLHGGLMMLPFAALMLLGPSIGSHIGRGRSVHFLLCIGFVIVLIGNLAASAVATSGHYWPVAIAMCVIGLGGGILNGTTVQAIMEVAPKERAAMASGLASATRFAGIVMSIGVLGAVMSQRAHLFFSDRVADTGIRPDILTTFINRVLSGDAEHTSGLLPDAIHASMLLAARTASAVGFADALLVSGAVSLLSCLAIVVLTRRARVARSAQPI
ncbi:MFS transporter [Trinickia mobilis]|uniref:MFS transporter n=1 Tax=Trinickia mobilis TaxID=2816356 RepID=UPI001A8EA82A|nr:MFS transporter [Trinickia mobilis]